ncbi:NAD(P)/FAD-dependent oxidoreductase [Streptomyces sp. NA04227]|uniref:phytoene desaturase family protein n=1 Tax=Streptomyces sp. NA04227 TaxID=2742136 RepID=UPI001590CCED|nr:NAD(P)/FAD-dependent oxidoreductase [Streptomyces sp. NA04227]QKW06008.1 NAD(P)/FAD-dependent oxidoreductase [Streptomyces sp. NA04227]
MARIAVIGAGTGALAAAARLAVAGHSVVVHERADTYGGALGHRTRDGFSFDTGPVLLPLPAVHRDLFLKTGKQPLEDRVRLTQIEPAVRHLFADGTRTDLPNASRAGVREALDSSLGGGAGALWADFMNRAREAWDRARRPLLEEPLWPNWQVLAEQEPYPALRQRRLLRRDLTARTLAEIATLELGDEPRLRALLEHYALAQGLDPRTVPASAAVLPYMEQTFGLWAVEGGMRELARAMYERCLERRVTFRFGAEVTRVVTHEGRATGIEVAGGAGGENDDHGTSAPAEPGAGTPRFEAADFVVAGIAPTLLDRLVPDGTPERADGPPTRPNHASRVTVLLALRGSRPADAPYRTVVHSHDRDEELGTLFPPLPTLPEHPTVTVHRPSGPGHTPDAEHEAVILTATAAVSPPERFELGEEHEIRPAYELFADRMIAAAQREIPDLSERLLWHEVLTPYDIARATGVEAVPAPALAAGAGQWLHPANSTGIDGLFTVGGWSHPGGGLPHAGMSGALVAGLIVEGPGFRGSQ